MSSLQRPKYIAVDESGRVYWYPTKPVRMQHGWFCEDVTWKEHLASELDIEYLGSWEDSLYELRARDCTAVHKDTSTGVPEPEVTDAVELTAEQQAILDAPQHAELPSEPLAYGVLPTLDVSKLQPPAEARWVAVDADGRAFYYSAKPQCGEEGWYSPGHPNMGMISGLYAASNWQEAIWPVNLTQGS